jgi:hypothetical protein
VEHSDRTSRQPCRLLVGEFMKVAQNERNAVSFREGGDLRIQYLPNFTPRQLIDGS